MCCTKSRWPVVAAAEIANDCRISLRVGAAGQAIGFTTNEERIVAWSQRYLTPVCSFARSDDHMRPTVAIIEDDILHQQLRAVATTDRGVLTSTYESEAARHHPLPGGAFALIYRDRPGVTLIDHTAGVIAFVTVTGDHRAPFEAVRVVREVLRRKLEHVGQVVLHSGAVELAGLVWMVCGPKLSGKTTLVCALVEHLGADFVSNDRVFLGWEASGFRVVSWPMSVRIGLGTCLASAKLRKWLRPGMSPEYPQSGWDPRRGLGEGEARCLAARAGSPKLELIPSELAGSLGGRVRAGGQVGGVFLPARNPARRSEGGRTVAIPPAQAVERLRSELLTPDDDYYPDWLGLRCVESPWQRVRAADLLERLVASHPVVEVGFDTGRDAARAIGKTRSIAIST